MPAIFSKLTSFLILILLALSLFSNVNSEAASFKFNPPNKQFLAGCTSAINILVDTEGSESNAADIEFYYNPSEITILDSVPNIAGKQIKPGDAYESYFGNIVDEAAGKIVLTGGSFVTSLNGNKTFATVEFQSKPGVTTTNFTIKFDGVGATRDSNVAEASTSDDLLTSIGNGSYTFTTGNCVADTEPPKIFFQTPKNYQLDVPLNNNVVIKITDNQSGVDINNLVFTINGDAYKVTDPEVSYVGNPLDYTFTINPRNDFYSDKASSILVNARDIAGNRSSDQIVFNIPPAVIKTQLCPAVGVDGSGTATALPSFPFLPRTGGFSGEVYSERLSQEAVDESLSQNDFITQITAKPIANNWFFANFFKASLRTLQLLSILGVLVFVLSLILILANRKYKLISSTAISKLSGDVLPQTVIKLFNVADFNLLAAIKTDDEGKFTFKVRPGSYILQINDATGAAVYQETVLVPQNNNSIFLNELPEKSSLNLEAKTGFKNLLDYLLRLVKSLAPGFYLLGLLFAIFNFIMIASWLNLFLLITTILLGVVVSLPGLSRALSTLK